MLPAQQRITADGTGDRPEAGDIELDILRRHRKKYVMVPSGIRLQNDTRACSPPCGERAVTTIACVEVPLAEATRLADGGDAKLDVTTSTRTGAARAHAGRPIRPREQASCVARRSV